MPLRDWLDSLPRKAQAKCQSYLLQLNEFGHELKRPVAGYLRDGIHELRPSYQGVHYRILYFFASEGKKKLEETRIVVLSHGVIKEQTVPSSEIDRAVKKGTFHKNTAARKKSRLVKATKATLAEAPKPEKPKAKPKATSKAAKKAK